MKKIFYLFAIVTLAFSSCTEADNVFGDVTVGGLLEVTTPALNYVVGDAKDYTVEYRVFQSADLKTNQVEAYIKFYTYKRNTDGSLFLDDEEEKVAIQSNERLLSTTAITESITHFVTFDIGLTGLIEGLSVEDNDFYTDLPTDDAQYLIGDYWEIRFVNTLSDGSVHENAKRVQVAVSTRFAGTYTVMEGEYFRIGADNGGGAMWVTGEVTIKSIDAITYEWFEWGILSGWAGNTLYFQIDGTTGAITYPAEWPAGTAQTLNGQPLTTPTLNPGDLTNVIPIAGVNINTAIKDDVDGKDQMNLCHGYYTGGSGPREFYFLLKKN